MSNKSNPFLIKTNTISNRWLGLKPDNNVLNKTPNEKTHTQMNERFKITNDKEESYKNDEFYEKKNMFKQSFKSDKPERRQSPGFMVYTNESKPLEKKLEINIEDMSETVLDNEFPTLG